MIYSLTDSGFFLTADASLNGNSLADAVDSGSKIEALFTAPSKNSRTKTVPVDSALLDFPALAALRVLATVAVKQDHEPGRKLLIWIGPGPSERATDVYAPYLNGVVNYSTLGEHHDERMRDLFQKFVWFTTLLRQGYPPCSFRNGGRQNPGIARLGQVTTVDIEAKVEASDVPKLGKLTIEQRRSMLLPLLAERFNLKYHHEKRDLPIYALVIAKGGPKLKESDAEFTQRGLRIAGRGHLISVGSSLKFLLPLLSRELGRTVLDHTGLTGRYDYDLLWMPDDGFLPAAYGQNGEPKDSTTPSLPPNLFTSLQEQLGLMLEPQKGPIDVMVIDQIGKPSEN